MADPGPADSAPGVSARPNPEPFEGSLIWWVEVPAREQNYLQAVLEGYDDLGYYQTLDPRARIEGGRPVALGRLTSHPDAREEAEALLSVLSGECGLRLSDRAPAFAPDAQPGGRAGRSTSRRGP